MFSHIKDFFKEKERRKQLIAFYREVSKNWESYHVMFQQNRYFLFKEEAYRAASSDQELMQIPEIIRYRELTDRFNKVLTTFKDFESWYVADMDHKTQENGQKLHGLKEEVRKNFLNIDQPMKQAQIRLEQIMRKMKIIK